MRFLLVLWGIPLAALVVSLTLFAAGVENEAAAAPGAIASLWLFVNIPITIRYVRWRVIWRAKRDARP